MPRPRFALVAALSATLATPALAHHQMNVFRPLIADPREDVFRIKYEDYVEDRRYGTNIADSLSRGGVLKDHRGTYWDDAFGARIPLNTWVWPGARGRGHMLQFVIPAGLFAQFDRAGADLVNADYQVGVSLEWANARLRVNPDSGADLDLRAPVWSARLEAFHRSTHLGDEYLSEGYFGRNQTGVGDEGQLLHVPPVKRVNLSFQAVRLIASFEGSPSWNAHRSVFRLYGGGEQKTPLGIPMAPPRFRSPIGQAGLEWWSSAAEPAENDLHPTWVFDRPFGWLSRLVGYRGRPTVESEYVLAADWKVAKPYNFASGDNPSGETEVWTPHLWSESPYGREFRHYAGSLHAVVGLRLFSRQHRREEYLRAPSALLLWEWYDGYSPNGQFLDQRLRYGPYKGWIPSLALTF